MRYKMAQKHHTWSQTRQTLHEIIFEADTRLGKLFDVSLIIFILASVLVVMLDSVRPMSEQYGKLFYYIEWGFTVIFTIEYLLRIFCIGRPLHYIFSFYGLVDLLPFSRLTWDYSSPADIISSSSGY